MSPKKPAAPRSPPRSPRPNGRPTKLDDPVAVGGNNPDGSPKMKPRGEAIIDAVRLGLPGGLAAEAYGIDRATFYEWVGRGQGRDQRTPTPGFVRFADEFTRAQAGSALSLWKLARAWASKDPRQIGWMLERRFPEDFARPADRGYGSTGAGEPVFADADARRIIREAAAQLPADEPDEST